MTQITWFYSFLYVDTYLYLLLNICITNKSEKLNYYDYKPMVNYNLCTIFKNHLNLNLTLDSLELQEITQCVLIIYFREAEVFKFAQRRYELF